MNLIAINKILTPDFLFIVLSVLESLSFLTTSLILFRIFTVALALSFVFLALWTGIAAAGMKAILVGSILDMSLNLWMIYRYFLARSIRSIPSEWITPYEKSFSLLYPYEFMQLIKQGKVIEFNEFDNRFLINNGEEFKSLYYILEGEAIVMGENGLEYTSLFSGDWISEMSFLSNQKTSSEVRSKSTKVISWEKDSLVQIQKNMPEIYNKLTGIISGNICTKLCRATKDNMKLQRALNTY